MSLNRDRRLSKEFIEQAIGSAPSAPPAPSTSPTASPSASSGAIHKGILVHRTPKPSDGGSLRISKHVQLPPAVKPLEKDLENSVWNENPIAVQSWKENPLSQENKDNEVDLNKVIDDAFPLQQPAPLVPPAPAANVVEDSPLVARRVSSQATSPASSISKRSAANTPAPQLAAEVEQHAHAGVQPSPHSTIREKLADLTNLFSGHHHAAPAANPRPITDGYSSTRRREHKPEAYDLTDAGDTESRIQSLRHKPNDVVISIHALNEETTEALVPVASTTFFGSLFGRYNNRWKTVKADTFVETFLKISQASEDQRKQFSNTIYGGAYFSIAMGVIGILILLTRETTNKAQNLYSTDRTLANILLDYSYSLILATLFITAGIIFAGMRSYAASEEARLNAEELRLWGEKRLNVHVTEQEISESRKRSARSI